MTDGHFSPDRAIRPRDLTNCAALNLWGSFVVVVAQREGIRRRIVLAIFLSVSLIEVSEAY